MENEKVRIRSDHELSIRKKEFLLTCDILEKLEINYFLHSGILLGAIRDNDFIKWDWDIEISVFGEEFDDKIDKVVEELKQNNFIISNINKKKNDFKIDFVGQLDKSVTGYTIWSWYYSKIRKVYWRRELIVPKKYLKNLSKINFMDREFKCPNNPKDYLAYAYGDWKTPIRTSDKDMYLSDKFKNKSIAKFLKFINVIKRILYKFKI
jgi:lipopolysaccharide cholinephosphotransferase